MSRRFISITLSSDSYTFQANMDRLVKGIPVSSLGHPDTQEYRSYNQEKDYNFILSYQMLHHRLSPFRAIGPDLRYRFIVPMPLYNACTWCPHQVLL